VTALLYIHGFNSSPQSHKASILKQWLAQQHPSITCEVPYLKPYPADAITQLQVLLENYRAKKEKIALVGSSLGGYYAAWLAEKYNLRAVLVNPSVRPFELLGKYIGEIIINGADGRRGTRFQGGDGKIFFVRKYY
jgi:predicted esterase YcpF (UPF0227 family)